MKKVTKIIATLFVASLILTSCGGNSKEGEPQDKPNENVKKPDPNITYLKKYIPQLGDIGDLFGVESAGDPPVCSSFEDIDKWNKYVKTNDEKIMDGIDVGIFFLSTGDKIRITDFKESKWGKCIEFRVMNGENQGKLAWGRVSDFRLIKSKIKQDKEANERGEGC